MLEIIDRDELTTREVWDREKAIEHFKKKGELYKAEIINSIPTLFYFSSMFHKFFEASHYLNLRANRLLQVLSA